MSDKLLNLMGSLQDENWSYDFDVLPVPEEEWDYVVTGRKFFDRDEDDRASTDFSFEKFLELVSDYNDVDMNSFVREEGPFEVSADGIYRHVVEIQVKE